MNEVTWWHNGDHPDDRVGEPVHIVGGVSYPRVEGAVVRFYRHPWTPGNKRHLGSDVTGEHGCGHRWHDHGWIDQGEDGITVCPGDTVVTEDDGTYSVKRGIDMSEIPSLGQVAFEAYRAAVGGQTFDGKPIPGWDELHGDRLKVQGGWEAAAQAVREHMRMVDALDRAGRSIGVRTDFREAQRSRWELLGDGMMFAPLGEPEPEFSAPIGRGEPPTGEQVPVDVEPDDGPPVGCDAPGCSRTHHH